MTTEELRQFNEVCGVDPEMDKIPAIVRRNEEREEYMKDKYTPDLEEAEKSEADQREADEIMEETTTLEEKEEKLTS